MYHCLFCQHWQLAVLEGRAVEVQRDASEGAADELAVPVQDLAAGHVHRQRPEELPAQDDRAQQVHPHLARRHHLLLPAADGQGQM